MARLKESKDQERKKIILATLDKYCRLRGCKRSELNKPIHLSESALYTRYRDPDMFRLSELRRLYEYLQVPEEERAGLK